MSSLDNFRRATRSKALKADIIATLNKHGLQLLEDGGMWVFLDDYTDTAKIHLREKGYADSWKHLDEFYVPVPEAP